MGAWVTQLHLEMYKQARHRQLGWAAHLCLAVPEGPRVQAVRLNARQLVALGSGPECLPEGLGLGRQLRSRLQLAAQLPHTCAGLLPCAACASARSLASACTLSLEQCFRLAQGAGHPCTCMSTHTGRRAPACPASAVL